MSSDTELTAAEIRSRCYTEFDNLVVDIADKMPIAARRCFREHFEHQLATMSDEALEAAIKVARFFGADVPIKGLANRYALKALELL